MYTIYRINDSKLDNGFVKALKAIKHVAHNRNLVAVNLDAL